MGVIFDLDQTIIDSSIAYEERKKRNWNQVYNLIPRMKPYKEVVKLIKQLINQGIEVAVVTSSPRPYCEKILNHLGISGVITVCYHDTSKHKPDPEPYQLAISKMNTQAGKIIVAIGDEEKDIIAAQKANIVSVLVNWSNKDSYNNTMVKPDVFCRDEKSLINYFSIQRIGQKSF